MSGPWGKKMTLKRKEGGKGQGRRERKSAKRYIPRKILRVDFRNFYRWGGHQVSQGVVPSEWKLANLSPILKTDDPTLSSNYRPISLLNTISKVLERCVFSHCSKHLEPQIYHLQHGFMKGRSTVTQLVEVYDDIVNSVASGKEVDVLYLDLAKAFDKVPHNLLLLKLQLHGITGPLLLWMQSYLSERKQRVVLEGASSDWLPVTSGVPQGSILGPLLFLVYVNDVSSCIINNSNIALFADDSKLYRAMDINYDHNLLQADLDCLHTWSLSSGLDFNSRKCKVLNISKKRSTREMNRNYSLGDQLIECGPSFVDLGITISHNLSWADHIEKIVVKANRTLGHRIRNRTRRDTSLMLGGSADIGLHTPARERRPCS